MRISAYVDTALDDVVALWDACDLNVPYNDPKRDIALVRDSANAELFLGYLGAQLIGSVMVGHDGHRGWMYRLAIATEHRQLGYGRTLVRHAEAWLRERGLRKSQLMIRETNDAVREFYVRLGYAVQPRTVMARWLDTGEDDASARQIEVVVTYLEMKDRPIRPTVPAPAGKLALLRAEAPSAAFYRYLYDSVGESWFWADRRRLDDATLTALVGDPKVEIYVLYVGGVPAGYVELDRRPTPDIAVAYFGIFPAFVGRGYGPYLLNWAVDQAWQYGPRRLTVDTCTLDHPKALRTYQRVGFVPYKQERKSIDDPRLAGLIPAHLEPRVPSHPTDFA
jgi:ribosomal protein S18 acetylase RimI-like enzyme